MADTQEIDAEGDVVLVCGVGGEQQRFRLSSVMLSRGSSVFKKMFTSKFKEGTQLQANGAIEISLPEDDATIMCILANVIHAEYDQVPSTLSLSQLWNIAKLVDKYDAAKMIKPMAKCWTMALLPAADNETRQALLIAAHMFQHAEVFNTVAKDITMKSASPITPDRDIACDIEVPAELLSVFDALEQERDTALESAASVVEKIMQEAALVRSIDGSNCTKACCVAAKRFQYIAECLMAKRLWPTKSLRAFPLESILKALRNSGMSTHELGDIKGITPCESRIYGACVASGKGGVENEIYALQRAATHIVSQLRTLCYECVRQGKALDPECDHASGKRAMG